MKNKIGAVLFLLLLAVVGYMLSNIIEFYDETITQEWSRAALRNPYLAAEQFLVLRGNDVESSNRLKRLDQLPENGTIYIDDPRQLKKQERIDALLEWMERGGHLVVAGRINRDDGENALLDYFGVTIEHAECACDENDENEPGDIERKKLSDLLREENKKLGKGKAVDADTAEKKSIHDSVLTTLAFENMSNPLKVHFDQEHILEHPLLNEQQGGDYNGPQPFYVGYSKAGPQFMQFYMGEGLFTVLSDGSVWKSSSIDEVDHALLLHVLLSSKNKIVLLRGMQMPSILKLLSSYAPELLVSSLVWLLIWVLYNMKRFGPIREHDISSRRSLDEHIVACSRHIWRLNKGEKIAANMQSSIFSKIKRMNLGFSALEKKQQVSWVSQQCGLSEKDVVIALYSDEVTSEEHLTQIVGLIQKIGNRL